MIDNTDLKDLLIKATKKNSNLVDKIKDFIWFSKTSYKYVVNKDLDSKIEFIVGFIPAYLKYYKYSKVDGKWN